MTLVSEIEWEACLLEPRKVSEQADRIRRDGHKPTSGVWYFSASPWVPAAMAQLQTSLFTHTWLDPEVADLAALVVSQDASCRFCFASQRLQLRMLGFSQDRIAQIEHDFLRADVDDRSRAAMEFARRLSRSDPLVRPDDARALLDDGFSEDELRELAVHVALMVFFNRISTLPALPPQFAEELPDRWYAPLVRPFLARFLKSLVRTGRPEALRPEQGDGPFGYLLQALDGLPQAHHLHRVLTDVWSPQVLGTRVKALAFAVIARALGCETAQAEALAIAGREGLGAEDCEEVLAHLASPKLDRVESILVPFARDTIWYQAAPVQRRARKVKEQVSEQEFVEFCFVAALANAVCRIGFLAGDCQ